jgi:hypothetical protein
MPIMYLLVAVLGEVIGEEMVYGLLALSILALATSGAAAVMMGITALVRLARRRGAVGHGWAITGLCTGPMPALAGMLGMLMFVLPLTMELLDAAAVSPVTVDAAYAAAPANVPMTLPAADPYGAAPVASAGHLLPSSTSAVETAALPPSPYGTVPAVAPSPYPAPMTPASQPAVSPPAPLPATPAAKPDAGEGENPG